MQRRAVGGRSPVNTAIHAGMVCHSRGVAGEAKAPQNIRSTDEERPQAETIVRGWAFALRDLCEQGAESVTVVLPGGLRLAYEDGALTVDPPEGPTRKISDRELDDVGYVTAEEDQ